jgi:PII-like signaling protein
MQQELSHLEVLQLVTKLPVVILVVLVLVRKNNLARCYIWQEEFGED